MTIDRMISLMVGRNIDQLFPPRDSAVPVGPPVLEVKNVTQRGTVKDISFTLMRAKCWAFQA